MLDNSLCFKNYLILKKSVCRINKKFFYLPHYRQNGELLHDLLNSCIAFANSTTSPSGQACKEVILEFPHQVIVRPSYSQRKGSWMLVRKITDVTPMSEFHDSSIAETFFDYYKNRYGINIADREQKLICLRGIPNHNSMLKKLHKILNLTSKSKISPHFVPELLDIHPLSACRFLTAICLPSVLFRMESLLSTDELRLKIADETGLGLEDDKIINSLVSLTRDASTYYVKSIGELPHVYHQVKAKSSRKLAKFCKEAVDTCKGSIRNDAKSVYGKWKRNPESSKELLLKHYRKLRRDISKLSKKTRKWLQIVPISVTKRLFPTFRRHVFNRRSKSRRTNRIISKPGPTVSMLLQALTSLSANDYFNHERLEILGDSYLKFASTADYYHRHPNMKESTMSQMRANSVSNLHLSNTSKVKGLTLYQFNTPFKLKQWVPPGYTLMKNKIAQPVIDSVNDDSQDLSQSCQQIMSVKNISDTVEGLVGVYSLASGPINASYILPWIGLDIDPKSLINSDKMAIYESPLTDDDIKLNNCITRSIGYQFKNFRWLRLAFTHSSFASENYQRLEHLGDAILEYLLIEFVFCRKPRFGPGKISYCKSLMTCNRTFAIVSIALQLHVHIRCDSRLKLDIVKDAEEILLVSTLMILSLFVINSTIF